MNKIFNLFILIILFSSCINKTSNKEKEYNVYLQPYNNFTDEEVKNLQIDVQNCFDTLIPELNIKINILKNKVLSKQFLNNNKTRYRADSIINNQKNQYDYYILGLTHYDISSTVHNIDDYGILGLSYCPGSSSVISDYRVKNKSLFYKVAVHELLHNLGLKHCPNNDRKCYICDANKKPQLEKQIFLCPTCKKKLLNKE